MIRCKKPRHTVAVIFSLSLGMGVAIANPLPETVQCKLKLGNSEVASCLGDLKHFKPVLEYSVENPVRHLQKNLSKNSLHSFVYSKSATSYRDTLRPIYHYQSQGHIDGKQVKLLLIGNDSTALDSSNSQWHKSGMFYQCHGQCPYVVNERHEATASQ